MSTPEPHQHELWMRKALSLAVQGEGTVRPNPLVGAIIVRGNTVLGQGWHHRAGEPHAEILALQDANDKGYKNVTDATLYVTLEPCCHTGRTGPCTKAIIQAGIGKLVCAMKDPNPLVAGKGLQELQDAGLTIITGILEQEAKVLNRVFIHYITRSLPWVTLKTAMSLDGKIATATGNSRWISGEEARSEVHHIRKNQAAILCGIGTALTDDPLLTVRLKIQDTRELPAPLRVICDTHLRLPPNSQLAQTARQSPVVIAVGAHALLDSNSGIQERVNALEDLGVEILSVEEKNGKICLKGLFTILASRGVDRLLIEGGSEIAAAALQEDLVNTVIFYIAPIILGGATAKGPVAGKGASTIDRGIRLEKISTRTIGKDIVIEGDIVSCLPD